MRTNIFISILILFIIVSCKKSNSYSPLPGQWNMSRVEGVSTGIINQTISLSVFYPASSGCDILDRFEQTAQGKIISIRAFGHTETSNFCTQAATEKSAILDFKPTSTGSFELRFIQRDNSYFTYSLTIN
jgi:hypothetical protein